MAGKSVATSMHNGSVVFKCPSRPWKCDSEPECTRDPEIEAPKWITGVNYWETLWSKAIVGSLCEELDNLNSHPW